MELVKVFNFTDKMPRFSKTIELCQTFCMRFCITQWAIPNYLKKSFHKSQFFINHASHLNCFPKFFIVIKVLNFKIAILSFARIFSKFYTTVALRVICVFVFIRSTANKFISRSWYIYCFLINSFCYKKGLTLSSKFIFLEHDTLVTFYIGTSRKLVWSPSKMSLISILLIVKSVRIRVILVRIFPHLD